MATYNLIRFDRAMKRLLRDKANIVVREGFLSELLQNDINIHHILESYLPKVCLSNSYKSEPA